MRCGDATFGIAIEDLAEVVGPIKALSPIMCASPFLLGGLDRRGDLIPVLDAALICGMRKAQAVPRFAVVLRHAGRLLAIGADEICGLAKIADDKVKLLDCELNQGHQVGGSAFLKDGNVTTVLDVPRIFQAEGALSIAASDGAPDITTEGKGPQRLTFDAGGVLFSVLATEVFGTVPRQMIIPGPVSGGMCLGTITYHDRRIPVISTVTLLGLGRLSQSLEAEVVVLRFPENRLVGLAVNAVMDIEVITDAEVRQTPDVILAMGGYLKHVRVDAGGTQTFILDVMSIWQDEKLNALADLSDPPTESKQKALDAEKMLETSALRERYLLFDAGEPMAAPLSHVVKIISLPRDITPLAQEGAMVRGLFSHGGQTIPLVSLSGGGVPAGNTEDSSSRVLLVGEVGHQVAFIVDRVKSIELSDWKHKYQTGQSSEVGSLVQLGTGASSRVYECIDLHAEAAQYHAALRAQIVPAAALNEPAE